MGVVTLDGWIGLPTKLLQDNALGLERVRTPVMLRFISVRITCCQCIVTVFQS